MAEETTKVTRRPITFQEISVWAREDNTAIDATARQAVEDLVKNNETRIKLVLTAALREKVSHYSYLMSGLDRVRNKLLEEDTVDGLNNDQLLTLFQALGHDIERVEKSLKKAGEDTKGLNIETLNVILDAQLDKTVKGIPAGSREKLRGLFSALGGKGTAPEPSATMDLDGERIIPSRAIIDVEAEVDEAERATAAAGLSAALTRPLSDPPIFVRDDKDRAST